MAQVLLIEPYSSDSHLCWAEGYVRTSDHDVRSVLLPAERWRWRFRMGAARLAEDAIKLSADGWQPDSVPGWCRFSRTG